MSLAKKVASLEFQSGFCIFGLPVFPGVNQKTMKVSTFLLVILLVFSSHTLPGQSKTDKIIDETIARSKEISMYSAQVNWDSLEKEVRLAAKGAESVEALKPAFEIMLNGLRDPHGAIRLTSNYSILASFTDHQNSRKKKTRDYDAEAWKVVNDVNARFQHAILQGNIGYLKVVGVGQGQGQEEAERIRNAVLELSAEKVDRWIIDLRYNGGGNINVMLAGLAPFFDTESVVSIRDGNGEVQGEAKIKNGDFWYYEMCAFPIANHPPLDNPKVAILTSRYTISSGELVAVAFKGQKNTRFFGEASGGLTTNNSWEIIGDAIALAISTGIYCDRDGVVYSENVPVDVEVEFELETDKSKDQGIIKAIEWLKQD